MRMKTRNENACLLWNWCWSWCTMAETSNNYWAI